MNEAAHPALDELAELCGIEPLFVDAHGDVRKTSPDIKRALLRTMGVAAENEEEAERSLAKIEDDEWRHVLPAVCVAQRNRGPATLEVVLGPGTRELRWSVALESGGVVRGTAEVDSLTLLATRTVAGRALERRRLVIDTSLPDGYHTLALDGDHSTTQLIVSPGTCWLPPNLEQGGRVWGVAAQLYSLRSESNWGIGDFSDLAQLISLVAARGGDVVGVNPLHALFPDEPRRASPYSPASRLLLNVLNIDVTRIPELAKCGDVQQILSTPDFRAQLEDCRQGELIDYERVAHLKLRILRRLFAEFCARGDRHRLEAFARFRASRPRGFERACCFQALRRRFADIGAPADWRKWTREFRDCESAAVASFAEDYANEIAEAAWMQWIADEQLQGAARQARGMAVGVYRDLAVGADPTGAEVWSDPESFVLDARIGAPPDLYNPAGQNWGLPPWNPRVLRTRAYRNFIELLRANMRHCGALRIDHAMALLRLYWVPEGNSPTEGAYVRYPFEDLLGILALESTRQRCVVVGEDLGTVPEGFRERMARARVLSYRILFFEHDARTGAFLPPASYPHLAIAMSGSHDLPTIRAWWEGADLELKERLGLHPDEAETDSAREQREADRGRLLEALRAAGVLDRSTVVTWRTLTGPIHEFLARSGAMIAMAQLEDIVGEREPINVPGTSSEYPNWQRRLRTTLEELAQDNTFTTLTNTFRSARRV
jgi:4-alpha-glucanotransferase